MSTELRASNVSLSYRSQGLWRRGQSVTALEDVSLSVAAGGSIGLVGSSGSGKSTLLRTLLALEKPATGTAELDGSPIRPGSASSLRWYRRLVQYVPQNPAGSLDPRMTVHQLLLEPLKQLHGPGDHHSMVREALERVELELGRHRRATLVGRVWLAQGRSLATNRVHPNRAGVFGYCRPGSWLRRGSR
jgi:peptide/nickel transport system ATP-binding protein